MSSESSFLGKGWGFPPDFDPHSQAVSMVSGAGDIEQSLTILLSTRPNERLMHPTYGCSLHNMVFETAAEANLTRMKDAIRSAVLLFEPRIDLEEVSFDQSEVGQGLLRILLSYRVRETNSRSNLVYPFYLSEGTNVA